VPASPLSGEQLAEIHRTVIRLTTDCGLDGWRISDLVAATGVSSRTVYKYFPSKEHLLAASLAETSAVQFRDIRESSMRTARTPRTRVRKVLHECTAGVIASPELSKAMARAWTSGLPWMPPLVSGFEDSMQATIAYVMAGGPPSPDQVAVAEILEMVWVAAVLAWTSGLRDDRFIIRAVDRALRVIALPD
jgi:AcrR family transcriptional regulator